MKAKASSFLVLYLKLLFSFCESTKESLNLFAVGIFILEVDACNNVQKILR